MPSPRFEIVVCKWPLIIRAQTNRQYKTSEEKNRTIDFALVDYITVYGINLNKPWNKSLFLLEFLVVQPSLVYEASYKIHLHGM